MGIPVHKIEAFPNLSPCYVTNWEMKTFVITVEYCGSDRPLKLPLDMAFFCNHFSIA